MMKKILPFICSALLLVSCGASSKGDSVYSSKQAMSYSSMKLYDSVMPEAAMEIAENGAIEEDGAVSSSDYTKNRKLIRNGSLRIKLETLDNCSVKVTSWVNSVDGYISNSNTWDSNASYTIRIPSSKFDEFMTSAGKFGKVTNQSVYTNDVTDTYYDLETRINSKKVLQEKYMQYLKKADNIKDLLEIEAQLNQVVCELESMEGQMKRLTNQIDYCTVNVEFYVPYENSGDHDIQYPDLSNSWNNFVTNLLAFLVGLFKVIIYIVVYGIPLLLLFAFLFWLLFGKIGLLRKLFSKLKK